jgi:hypothetical protein
MKSRYDYSTCTGSRSSENICSSSGGAQENFKRGSKQDETQFTTQKNGAFPSFTCPLLNLGMIAVPVYM